ncbi:MAG: energy-coupling factor transporter transmembrane component T family protein [Eubacterium sp.]|uniref:energy-coupling factor transporter transmembrane component T family protein n=1 Tax=Eubacterium sp. TaxID=142586 RepID=UPI0026727DF1|nr:energy-coupling factor transporter transmembrane component T [uncultured Eubacterium sp.]
MTDEFSRYHPVVNLIFYLLVLGTTMFQMSVGLVFISLFSAVVYYFMLKKTEGLKYCAVVVGIIIVSAIINPLFSHKGGTLLFYLFTGNPVTLESIIYGLISAIIIGAMLLWFSTFNQVMGVERILGAIGKVLPNVSLLITMIMRFIPQYTRHQRKVSMVNKVNKRNYGEKINLLNREKTEKENVIEACKKQKKKNGIDKIIYSIKEGSRTFSITTTWALENSIYTADSMKARGFGTGRRTNYSNYKFQKRDYLLMGWLVILWLVVVFSLEREKVYTYYYPFIQVKNNVVVYLIYGLLCLTPVLINVKEEIRWLILKSRI